MESIGEFAQLELEKIFQQSQPKRIFLVTGKRSYEECSAEKALRKALANVDYYRFSDFDNNPKIEDIGKGVDAYRELNPDMVLAVGGGSTLDMAKLINCFAANFKTTKSSHSYQDLEVSEGVPLIAIPTTSGSGSEATQFAVLYISGVKYSIDDKRLLPRHVILDKTFTYAMSPRLTATTGFDALSQAIESYWSVKANEESQTYAEAAIRLVLSNLESSVKGDFNAREQMLQAAHLAGKAINISRTTAPHAISYVLTSKFNVPHGHAVALLVGKILSLNALFEHSPLNETRGIEYCRMTMNKIYSFMEVSSASECMNKWYQLMDAVGLESSLEQLGIGSEEDINFILENINYERMNNNPVKLSKDQLRPLMV